MWGQPQYRGPTLGQAVLNAVLLVIVLVVAGPAVIEALSPIIPLLVIMLVIWGLLHLTFGRGRRY